MGKFHLAAASAAAVCLLAPACAAPLPEQQPAGEKRIKEKPMSASSADHTLPPNQRFQNLDEYLAFLEQTQAPVDGAWYKRVSPDRYVLQIGNLRTLEPEARQTMFTRDELNKKFGFAE